MRRFLVLFSLVAMLFGFVFSADAATSAKSINTYATVSNDGSCQVTLTAFIHLDQVADDLEFPLPVDARNITVNGSRAQGRVRNGLRYISLSRTIGKAVGDFTLTFTYNLPNLISTNDAGFLQLQLPILSGFSYPVQALEFSVSLPGPISVKPAFSSGYHQANIEKDIHYTVSGATISGSSQVELKDHETLSLILSVNEAMFPQKRIVAPNFQTVNVLIFVFALLALLYWALFLRNLPSWPFVRPMPPEGYTAGMLGSVLHLRGGDLSMMVFSWAQMGYLLIHMDHRGKVLLYRQMDMGNERSAFEQRCFKLLFGRRNVVDTDSLFYGEICRTVEKIKPNLTFFIHPKSGNLYVFRVLAAVVGMFCGISMGIGMSAGAALQWLWVVALGALAFFSSWYLHNWCIFLLTAGKHRLWYMLALCGLWIGFGALAEQSSMGLGLALGQLVAGLLVAFGGRRTKDGRHAMGEVLGLRRYLKKVSPEQLQRICQANPEYFHQLAPYALALGVIRPFAKQFHHIPIGPCPYISIGTDSTMRANQWSGLMVRVFKAMNARQQSNFAEKISSFLRLFSRG